MNPISGYSPRQPLSPQHGASDAHDRQIRNLMETKVKLEGQKNEISLNQNIDEKVRKERIQALVGQIQAIDAQISQIKMDKMKEKQEELSGHKETKNATRSSETTNMDQIAQNHLAAASIEKLNNTQQRMEHKAKDLKNEIRVDTLRIEISTSGLPNALENAEAAVFGPKREQINDINGKINTLNKKIGELYGKLHKTASSEKPLTPHGGQQGDTVATEEEAPLQGDNKDREVRSLDVMA